MESLQAKEVKFSPKLSRRKRSRPVKFNQDFVLTDINDEFSNSDDYMQSATEASSAASSSPAHALDSYEGSPLSMDAAREDYGDPDCMSRSSSADMIQRTIPSIRDSTHLKVGNPKRIKLEDNRSPGKEEQNSGQQEAETTFSSLLHTFASQVTRTVDSSDRRSQYKGGRSPYREPTVAPDSIWTTQSGNSPAAGPASETLSTKSVTSKQCATTSSSNVQHDVSFSGLLQNFVTCVNDSSNKQASPNPTISMAHTQSSMNPNKSIPFTVGTECQSESNHVSTSTQSPFSKDQKSFAGLLYSFASVVDKEGQGISQEPSHPVRANFLPVNRSEGSQQKPSKSLLDVLHDTISRRVMESAFLPSHNPSKHIEQLSNQKSRETGLARTPASDSLYDLHPSGQQWSHIKNVLPPLDAEEDDASVSGQKYQHLARQTIVGERNEKDQNDSASPIIMHRSIKEEPLDDEQEVGQSFTGGQRIKEEPIDYASSSTWDPAGQDVNSTLRERLLSRIESRQSPPAESPPHSNTAASSEDTEFIRNGLGKDKPETDVPATVQDAQEQAGLVSHLLTSGDSLKWKSKCTGSFADLLHNITSTMLEKGEPAENTEIVNPEKVQIKEEPQTFDEEQETHSAQDHPLVANNVSSQSVNELHLAAEESASRKPLPPCISRLLSGPSISGMAKESQGSDRREGRVQKLKEVSYTEHSSSPASPSSSDDPYERDGTILSKIRGKQSSPRSRHSGLLKQRLKRGTKHALKLKQGWPKRRGNVSKVHHKIPSLQHDQELFDKEDIMIPSQEQQVESDTSFTGLLQKLAQKCQAGSLPALGQQSPVKSRLNPAASGTPQQSEIFAIGRQPEQIQQGKTPIQSRTVSNFSHSSSVRSLLTRQRQAQQSCDADPTSDSPSTSVQLGDVSFSHLMKDMATTVKKTTSAKKSGVESPTPFEDLRSLDPPSPWVKSTSGNWLRFVLISPDENPSVTISVSINLWNNIHEVKIHCHHLEVPVYHWIFRRFGKRIHTKAALRGILQAISSGCSICEGTTRTDLVQMYRNKLTSTSRWQAAALLEESFGTTTIRSKQCELLVSGLRRSREKRCSKCSMYVDRKLKAVMYQMRKKIGLT